MGTHIQSNSSNALGWLGIMILVGLFVFKWIPDWTWRADLPKIDVNNYIFESHPAWRSETAIIETVANPTIHIRISPKNAIVERAHLKVTVNGAEVSDNCAGSADYFCYKIPSGYNPDGTKYTIVAKNDTGETHATIKVAVKPKPSGSNPKSTPSDSSTTKKTEEPSNDTNSGSEPPSTKSSSCLHYESGICLDDYEDEAYSYGLYDYSNGYYGASLDYPDDCNTICREALEDAYDEGWYDSH